MAKYEEPYRDANRGKDPLSGLRNANRHLVSVARQELSSCQRVESIPEKVELARNFLIETQTPEDFSYALRFLKNVINLENGREGHEFSEVANDAFHAVLSATYVLGETIETLNDVRLLDLEELLRTIKSNKRGREYFREILFGEKSEMLQAASLLVLNGVEAASTDLFSSVLADCISSKNSALRIAALDLFIRCSTEECNDNFVAEFLIKYPSESACAFFTFKEAVCEQFASNHDHPIVFRKSLMLDDLFIKFWNGPLENEIIQFMLKPVAGKDPVKCAEEEANKRRALRLLAVAGIETCELPIRKLFQDSPELFAVSGTVQRQVSPFLQSEAQALLNRNKFLVSSDSTAAKRDGNLAALIILINLEENSPFQICRLLNRQFEREGFYIRIADIYRNFSNEFNETEMSLLLSDSLEAVSRIMPEYKDEKDYRLRMSEDERLELAMSVIFPKNLSVEQLDKLRPMLHCGIPKLEVQAALKFGPENSDAKKVLLSKSHTDAIDKIIYSDPTSDNPISFARKWLGKFLVNLPGKEGEFIIRRQLVNARSADSDFFRDILVDRFLQRTSHRGIQEIVNILKFPPYEPADIKMGPIKSAFHSFLKAIVDDEPGSFSERLRSEKINNILEKVALSALKYISPYDLKSGERKSVLKALRSVDKQSTHGSILHIAKKLAEDYRI